MKDRERLRDRITEVLSFAIYEAGYKKLTKQAQQDVFVHTEEILTLLPPQELMSEDEIVNKIITALQDPTACLGLSRTQVGPIAVWIASVLSGKIAKPPEKVERCRCGRILDNDMEVCPECVRRNMLGKPTEKVERCEHEYILPNNGTIDAFCRKCGAWKISPPEKKEIEEVQIGYSDLPSKVMALTEKINELVQDNKKLWEIINIIRRGEK